MDRKSYKIIILFAFAICTLNTLNAQDSRIDSQDLRQYENIKLDSRESSTKSSFESNAKSNRKNGFVGRIGISADYLYHRADSSQNSSNISGVIMSIQGALGWNWRDYAKAEVGLLLGAGPTDIKGAYPIGAEQIGAQPLSNFSFKGGIALNFAFEAKGGYNISSAFKAWDNAFFINAGVEVAILSHFATYTPYSTQLGFLNLFVEIEGRSALTQKWAVDYFVRGFGGASLIGIGGEDLQTSESEIFSQTSLWGVKIGIGTSYKISDKAFVFVRLVSAYYNSGAGQNKRISIKQNPSLNGLNAGAGANFKYPKSHLFYGGVQFGVGI